jgi:hypothetical protein
MDVGHVVVGPAAAFSVVFQLFCEEADGWFNCSIPGNFKIINNQEKNLYNPSSFDDT